MQEQEITDLIQAWQLENPKLWHELVPLIYDQLKKIAHFHVAKGSHDLQTTELLHEALIKLEGQNKSLFQNRSHFFSIASTLMRRIMTDQARSRLTQKRGGDLPPPAQDMWNPPLQDAELVHLDEALKALAEVDPPLIRLVECRVYGGFTIKETADILKISVSSVKREWEAAKLFLFQYLNLT